MAVDVVVVNYRTPDLLADFIDSYERSAFEGCTLTVVDVTPVSESETALVMERDSVDSYIYLPDNCGYGRACNLGAEYGVNNAILLANSDTLLTPQLAECHVALLAHDDWGILGPRQVNEQNVLTAAGIFGDNRDPRHRGWREHDFGQYADVRDDAVTVSGSLYMIKRAVWDQLTTCLLFQEIAPDEPGAFLPTRHYYDETWCSYHARAHGWKCVYYGPAKMTHLWHASSPKGGAVDQQMPVAQRKFREACAHHGIECD